jgi:DHA1 family multidrug resistance protein-like MFS transporter
MLGIGIVAPILPIYAEQNLGASGIWIGLIFAGFGISRTIITPFVGRTSDDKGRKIFLLIGLLGYTLTGLGYVIATDVVFLTIVRFANGFTSAMVLPVAQAYIGDITPKGKEGVYMNTFMISLMIGFGVGPFLGGLMTDAYDAFAAFYAMAALSAFALALVIIFLPKVDDLLKNPNFASEEIRKTHMDKSKASMRSAIKDDYVKGIFIYRTAIGFSRNALVSFLPIFLVSNFAASATEVGLVLAVFLLTGACLQPLMGMLADRLDKIKLITVGMTFSATFIFLMPLIPSLWFLGAIAFVASFFSVCADAPALALGTQLGRKHGMATVLSIYDTAIGLGMVGGPLISGLFLDNFGINSIFYLWGIVGVIAVFITYMYLKRGREFTNLEKSKNEKVIEKRIDK